VSKVKKNPQVGCLLILSGQQYSMAWNDPVLLLKK